MTTRFGTYRGGYFPLVYDAARSTAAERHVSKSKFEMFENQYFRATTPKGHTIGRLRNVRQPVALNLDLIPWKIGQVIHDLSFREAIMDADKILSDTRVVEAMDDTFGHEYTKTLRPYLQSIANSRNVNDAALDWVEKSVRWARINMTMVGVGFRITTMLKHGSTALSNSVGELGRHWMMTGLKEFFGTPRNMARKWDFVMEKSGDMRNRMAHYDRDVRENLRTLLGETGLKERAQRCGFYGVAFLDMMSALPTWLGAYRKAISEGSSDADAVYFADKTVRKAHGSAGLVDLAKIQRGTELQKTLTMFYSFFNHIYNRQRDIVRRAGLGAQKVAKGDYAGARRDFAMVLARSFYYLAVPALVEAYYTSGAPNEDEGEGWGEWAAKAIGAEIPAGIPVVRDLAKAAIEGRNYEMSPIGRAAETVVHSGMDIGSAVGLRENEASDHWLRHAMETVGYLTGWPSGQAGESAQYLWDIGDGEENPQDVSDFLHGIIYGRGKDQ